MEEKLDKVKPPVPAIKETDNRLPDVVVDSDSQELIKQLVAEKDSDKVQSLLNAININQVRKNAIRLIILNGLQAKIDSQILERISTHPDEFTNKELLDYMTATQAAIVTASDSFTKANVVPTVHLNQQSVNINVGVDALSRTSAEKIAAAVTSVLKLAAEKDKEQANVSSPTAQDKPIDVVAKEEVKDAVVVDTVDTTKENNIK